MLELLERIATGVETLVDRLAPTVENDHKEWRDVTHGDIGKTLDAFVTGGTVAVRGRVDHQFRLHVPRGTSGAMSTYAHGSYQVRDDHDDESVLRDATGDDVGKTLIIMVHGDQITSGVIRRSGRNGAFQAVVPEWCESEDRFGARFISNLNFQIVRIPE